RFRRKNRRAPSLGQRRIAASFAVDQGQRILEQLPPARRERTESAACLPRPRTDRPRPLPVPLPIWRAAAAAACSGQPTRPSPAVRRTAVPPAPAGTALLLRAIVFLFPPAPLSAAPVLSPAAVPARPTPARRHSACGSTHAAADACGNSRREPASRRGT